MSSRDTTDEPKVLSEIDRTFFTCDEMLMDADCEKKLAVKIAKAASAASAKLLSSRGGKVEAYTCLFGIRWSNPLVKAVSSHGLCGLTKRGLANPATSQMATKFRSGLFEVWNSVGGEVDVFPTSWSPFIEEKGRSKEATRQGWGQTITKLKDWLIRNPNDLAEAKWGLMNTALSDAQRRQLALKLWKAATAKEPMASDVQRRELVLTEMNPRSAFELADTAVEGPIDANQPGKAHKEAAREVGLEDEAASRWGPGTELPKQQPERRH